MVHFSRLVTVLVFFNLIISLNSFSQPFGIPVKTGSYAVGFRSYWKNDDSRIFNAPALDPSIKKTDVASRPVLVNAWYPSVISNESGRMEYGKYLEPVNDKTVSEKLVSAYKKYNRATAVNEIIGKEEGKLNEKERTVLRLVLGTKTAAYHKAKAVNRKFPVIIYHPGNGASLDDNIILCELLASHGYIVISSSYFNEAAETWGVDGAMGSVRDISFILSNLASWETNAEIRNTAMIGHSAGAQAVQITMAQGSLAVKAMISLETTQEYYTLADKRWRRFINPTLQGIEKVKGDLLFVAKPGAIFQLADSMKNANRYYYTIPDVAHNDFISQGIVHKYANKQLDPSAKNEKEFNRVSADYTSLCNLALKFINAKLKNMDSEWTAYPGESNACSRTDQACMEWVPAGKSGPAKYVLNTSAPGVRQFRQLVSEDIDAAIVLLKAFYSDASKYAFCDFTYAYAVIDELMENDRKQTAKILYSTYKKLFGNPFTDDFKFKCEFFGMFNKVIAEGCYNKLAFLEKED